MSEDSGERLLNTSAPREKQQKYAQPERERRFLLRALPEGGPDSGLNSEIEKTATIVDRYLIGTRLRLRRSFEVGRQGSRTLYKLTQKVPAPSGGPGLITTVYLDEAEYHRLAAIPAAVLTKTRYSIAPLGVDVFDPPLVGLVLAEVEFDTDEAMRSFRPPPSAIAEVTLDRRFTGGQLVTMTASALAPLLLSFGIHPAPIV
jgi:hypothetical protein